MVYRRYLVWRGFGVYLRWPRSGTVPLSFPGDLHLQSRDITPSRPHLEQNNFGGNRQSCLVCPGRPHRQQTDPWLPVLYWLPGLVLEGSRGAGVLAAEVDATSGGGCVYGGCGGRVCIGV